MRIGSLKLTEELFFSKLAILSSFRITSDDAGNTVSNYCALKNTSHSVCDVLAVETENPTPFLSTEKKLAQKLCHSREGENHRLGGNPMGCRKFLQENFPYHAGQN